MDDIDRELKKLDQIPSRDLWEAAQNRQPGPEVAEHRPSPVRRAGIIVVALSVFAAAGAFGWAALRPGRGSDRLPTADEESPPPAGVVPDVVRLTCTEDGGELATPVVAIQRDGLHVQVANDADALGVGARDPENVGSNWSVELQGGPTDEFVIRYQPGEFIIGCILTESFSFHDVPASEWAPLSVVDSDAYWAQIKDEDTCGEPLPAPVATVNQPAELAGPLTGRMLVEAWSDQDRGDLLAVNPDGSDVDPIFVGPDEHWDGTWSPDGSQLAFVGTDPASERSEIFVMNADGSDLHPIGSGGDLLSWSPDGTRLLFRDHDEDGEYALFVMNIDGSGRQALPTPGEYANPGSWSPDGSRIAFVGSVPGQEDGCDDLELLVMNADGSNLVRLTDDEFYEQAPVWSPDGGTIAFMASNQSDYAWDVFVVNVDGSDLQRLTDHPGYDGQPVWSPDGSMLAFSSDRGATPEELERNEGNGPGPGVDVYVMNPDGSGVQQVLSSEGIFGDGSHAIFVGEWRAT